MWTTIAAYGSYRTYLALKRRRDAGEGSWHSRYSERQAGRIVRMSSDSSGFSAEPRNQCQRLGLGSSGVNPRNLTPSACPRLVASDFPPRNARIQSGAFCPDVALTRTLSLLLDQDVKRTHTSKLSIMLGVPKKKRAKRPALLLLMPWLAAYCRTLLALVHAVPPPVAS
jgi:hypothetical protein